MNKSIAGVGGTVSVCRFCGHDNGDVNYVICSNPACKRPKAGTKTQTPFPVNYDFHPEADMHSFIAELAPEDYLNEVYGDWRPDAAEVSQMCTDNLTVVTTQTLIRRFGWHMAGAQEKMTLTKIDDERGVSHGQSGHLVMNAERTLRMQMLHQKHPEHQIMMAALIDSFSEP